MKTKVFHFLRSKLSKENTHQVLLPGIVFQDTRDVTRLTKLSQCGMERE